jgi:hypothetical protein
MLKLGHAASNIDEHAQIRMSTMPSSEIEFVLVVPMGKTSSELASPTHQHCGDFGCQHWFNSP